MSEERAKRIVVRYDYLDGTKGYSVEKPTEWDEEVSLVPASVLAEYDAAYKAFKEAEARLVAAAEDRRKNPKYRPAPDDEAPAHAH